MDILWMLGQVFLYSVICYWISGVIHELGHIFMGLIHGWQFYLLVVGPFKLKRDQPNGKIRFQIEKNIAMWGGIGGTYPVRYKKENLTIWSKILMAGPITSIMMGIIILPFALTTKNLFLLLLGAMPLAMGIMCALPLPLKTGFLYTDGRRWARLRKGGQEEAEEKALFQLMEHTIIHGEKAVPPLEIVSTLLQSKEDAYQYYGHYYMYLISSESNNQEQMEMERSCMEDLKTRVPKLVVDDCKFD